MAPDNHTLKFFTQALEGIYTGFRFRIQLQSFTAENPYNEYLRVEFTNYKMYGCTSIDLHLCVKDFPIFLMR